MGGQLPLSPRLRRVRHGRYAGAGAHADGLVRQSSDLIGRTAAYVTEADGTYYDMAHLAGFAPDQTSGQKVKVGDVVGFVGNTGDAQGGATHVHFEIHPNGGEPV